MAKTARQLRLSQSELTRCLAMLGDDAAFAGMALLEVQERDGRRMLCLGERGRLLLGQQA